MKHETLTKWHKLTLWSFLIVGLLGLVMRYKIQFELPWVNQKNIQHAHSHFAFAGWVTQTLMVFMVSQLSQHVHHIRFRLYTRLLAANLMLALCMLVSFSVSGYSIFSIVCSTLSILVSFIFSYCYSTDLAQAKHPLTGKYWLKNALVFQVISSLGTFVLAYMMATKNVHQEVYLASIYWYLHFQYNGWFFFACVGLLLNHFSFDSAHQKQLKQVLGLFVFAGYAGYLLSILWVDLPLPLFIVSLLASIVQVIAWVILLRIIFKTQQNWIQQQPFILKAILLLIVAGVSLKILLQAGSNIPELSKLAFGLRPVVIAYLHLILLSIISVFLVIYPLLKHQVSDTTPIPVTPLLFVVSGIYFNQLLLGVQAVGAVFYINIPGINLWLLAVAVFICCSLFVLAKRIYAQGVSAIN